jgi:2',3'-cyclic-nucleotide 2'-phosphodiesterase (5'-nucleotidase family)
MSLFQAFKLWNDVKVGIVGLVGDWLNYCPGVSPDEVQYLDIFSTAKQLCEDLKSQGAEIIIALTHCDAETDKKLSEAVPDINVILGGHSSSYRVINAIDERFPSIVKSGSDFSDFSFINASFDNAASGAPTIDWPPKRYSIAIEDNNLPPSQVLVGLQAKMTSEEGHILYSDIVGYSNVNIDATTDTLRSRECPLGNLIADAIRQYTSVDIALVNGGFIGSNASIPPGFISFGQLNNMLPYNDLVVVLALTGSKLVRCLENSVSRLPSLDGRFLHVSGIKYDYCPDAPQHRRVAHVQVRKKIFPRRIY